MLWGLINKLRGVREEPTKPDTNAKIHALANVIDQQYDALMHPGMPMDLAIRLEQERAAAHGALAEEALRLALADWQRPPRMR